MSSILIKNARIISTSSDIDRFVDIYIEDGIINAIGENLVNKAENIIDASGLIAGPGLVDMHVHMRDPGYIYKDDIITVGDCAAAGGVTSVAAMPNTNPVTDTVETIRYIIEKSNQSKVRVYPVAAISSRLAGNGLTNFKELKTAGAVAFSDDGEPVATAKLLSDALKQASLYNMNILAHCEDKSLSNGGIINEGVVSEALGVKGIPLSAEDIGTARELVLANALNARVHICHVSTASSAELIRFAKQNGVKVTAETCPHYFSFSEELLYKQDADYRMNPPLRTDMDRSAIVNAIVDGTIDVIATDHAPHSADEKKDFQKAPNGVVGLETSLAAGITYLVNKGLISLSRLIDMMSTIPAQILGLEAGSLTIGKPADIVLFDPLEHWIVDTEKLHGKSKNSPFKGIELCGKVKYTVCRGKIVYKD